MSDDLFSGNVPEIVAIDPAKDYLPELVGEGKKFKTPADLARSVLHKDQHIARLEKEAAEMREEVNKALTMDEFLGKLSEENKKLLETNKVNNQSNQDGEPPEGEKHEQQQLSRDDVKRILDEERDAARKESNFRAVQAQLSEKLGAGYVEHIKTKAKELDLGEDFLNNLAKTQPKAFLEIMGIDKVTKKTSEEQSIFSPAQSSVQTRFSQAQARPGSAKTQKEWNELRTSNPRAYHNAFMQRTKDAQALGDKFFE